MADPRKFPTMINDVNSLVVNTLSTTSPAIANFIGAMLPLAELAIGIFVAFSLMGWLINTFEDLIHNLKERSPGARYDVRTGQGGTYSDMVKRARGRAGKWSTNYDEETSKDWFFRKK